MDIGSVGSEQALLVHMLNAAAEAIVSNAHMDGDGRANLASQRPVMSDDLHCGELGATRRQSQCEELVLRREILGTQPPDILGLWQVAIKPPVGQRSIGVAIGEDGANA